jgi:hypothetical protein
MAHGISSSRGCGTCGGSHSQPTSPPAPVYDPCAGGLVRTAATRERGCGCAGGGSCGCSPNRSPATKTYDRDQCPTFAISCETKQALRDCAKVALCDLLRCVSDTLCPDGTFDASRFQKTAVVDPPPGGVAAPVEPPIGTQLLNCFGQALCTFMHCVPEALCPEPCATTAPIDCLPCGYAVEVSR